MRIFVTVAALGKRDRLFEISASMALGTIDGGMLSFQRELRLRVIEMRSHRLQRDILPTACVVAGGTALRETAVMRIFVAIGTLVERNSRILRLAIGAIRMTLRALHLRVHSRQGVASLRVIELADVDLLPILEVVARLAGGSEPPFVLVLVASEASGGKPHERPI